MINPKVDPEVISCLIQVDTEMISYLKCFLNTLNS